MRKNGTKFGNKYKSRKESEKCKTSRYLDASFLLRGSIQVYGDVPIQTKTVELHTVYTVRTTSVKYLLSPLKSNNQYAIIGCILY